MNRKFFATVATSVVAAIAGFAIGYFLSSGSIGGWIAFPKAAAGLVFATYLALTGLFSATLFSFAFLAFQNQFLLKMLRPKYQMLTGS